MIYAKLFTLISHFGLHRFGMQNSGDKILHPLRVSVHQRCSTVTFIGTLRESATAAAVRRPASAGILRFMRMAIVHAAGCGTLPGGIARSSRRLQCWAHNGEAIP